MKYTRKDAKAHAFAHMKGIWAAALMPFRHDLSMDEEGFTVEAPVKNDMKVLHDFTNDLKMLDATQRLKVESDGTIVFNFGKYIGQEVKEVLMKDKQYYHWILNKEFSAQVKKIVQNIVRTEELKNYNK